MPSSLQEFWNEFDWEKELRKDDERIHIYFRELPAFIDLPYEDDLIFKRIKQREDLIPHGGVWPASLWDQVEDGEESDLMTQLRTKAFASPNGGKALILCSRQMKKLAMLSMIDLDFSRRDEILRLHCLASKLTITLLNMLSLMPSDLPALRITLCKRLLAILNDIFGNLKAVSPHTENEEILELIRSMLYRYGIIRNIILDFLCRFRKPDNEEKTSENPFLVSDDEPDDDDDIPELPEDGSLNKDLLDFLQSIEDEIGDFDDDDFDDEDDADEKNGNFPF